FIATRSFSSCASSVRSGTCATSINEAAKNDSLLARGNGANGAKQGIDRRIVNRTMFLGAVLALLPVLTLCATVSPAADSASPALAPVVEVEEDVYTFESADNGAGPMWCSGSTCLVHSGDQAWACGLETLKDLKPL